MSRMTAVVDQALKAGFGLTIHDIMIYEHHLQGFKFSHIAATGSGGQQWPGGEVRECWVGRGNKPNSSLEPKQRVRLSFNIISCDLMDVLGSCCAL